MVPTLVLLAVAAASLAAVGLVWAGRRARREEPYCVFRCPGCGQKVRYQARKAGRAALCPRCRRPWTLPAGPQDLPDDNDYTAEGYSAREGGWRPTRLTTGDLRRRGPERGKGPIRPGRG
jgi:hypothetical protein